MDNDCDVIQEIPQPVDKCDCSSSNKKSEPLSQKSREDSVSKVELESEPEPENVENNMQEYLDRECRSQGEQPLDCTLDFIKMPQPERDWIDYKPGIDTNSVSQKPETSEKQMEHQADTRTHGNLIVPSTGVCNLKAKILKLNNSKGNFFLWKWISTPVDDREFFIVIILYLFISIYVYLFRFYIFKSPLSHEIGRH